METYTSVTFCRMSGLTTAHISLHSHAAGFGGLIDSFYCKTITLVKIQRWQRKREKMLFKTQSAAVYGIDANIIEVEVDVSPNRQPEDNFQTVGLPDAAVRESRQRIR